MRYWDAILRYMFSDVTEQHTCSSGNIYQGCRFTYILLGGPLAPNPEFSHMMRFPLMMGSTQSCCLTMPAYESALIQHGKHLNRCRKRSIRRHF